MKMAQIYFLCHLYYSINYRVSPPIEPVPTCREGLVD